MLAEQQQINYSVNTGYTLEDRPGAIDDTVCNILMFAYTLYVYTYLPNPSTRLGNDTRSIFRRNLIGLNSELSFS